MSLVKVENRSLRPAVGKRTNKSYEPFPEKVQTPPPIDYEKLKELCSIEGLKGRDNKQTSEEAHHEFMETYKQIFVKPQKKIGFPVHSVKRSEERSSDESGSVTHKATGQTTDPEKNVVKKEFPIDNISHDIRDYLPLLHKQRKSEDPDSIQGENMKTLRKLLRKLPFERTAADNDRVFTILKTFPFFEDNIPPNVLKELCVVAVSEVWKEAEFTVFGKSALHMVLRGSVAPLTHPYLYTDVEAAPIVFQTREPDDALKTEDTLYPGECFGTLKKIEDNDPSSKILSVVTREPNCEFLKISASDYARVIEQIRQREHTEKVNLLLSCGQYKLWPRQPLLQVAELIEWISYPPNTVLVSEGYKAPYIAFIKSGECHVLRQVEVMHTVKQGKKEKRTKQVVMGRLGSFESFAELSVLLDEPITCSVVTATQMELGVIRPERLKELDDVTVQLFQQSNTRTFGNLTKADIQEEYIQQELKREWNEFKHSVVVDVINHRGIRPGYGKWSK